MDQCRITHLYEGLKHENNKLTPVTTPNSVFQLSYLQPLETFLWSSTQRRNSTRSTDHEKYSHHKTWPEHPQYSGHVVPAACSLTECTFVWLKGNELDPGRKNRTVWNRSRQQRQSMIIQKQPVLCMITFLVKWTRESNESERKWCLSAELCIHLAGVRTSRHCNDFSWGSSMLINDLMNV